MCRLLSSIPFLCTHCIIIIWAIIWHCTERWGMIFLNKLIYSRELTNLLPETVSQIPDMRALSSLQIHPLLCEAFSTTRTILNRQLNQLHVLPHLPYLYSPRPIFLCQCLDCKHLGARTCLLLCNNHIHESNHSQYFLTCVKKKWVNRMVIA